MLCNFCHGLWDTTVECDVVSSDGYEADNLVSRDKSKREKGFLAARFVKPVVNLLVTFPFPVEICAVNINPRVGGQRSRGFEVLAAGLQPSVQAASTSSTLSQPSKTTSVEAASVQPSRITSGSSTNEQGHVQSHNKASEIRTFHCYKYDLNVFNVKETFRHCFVQALRVQISEAHVGQFVNPTCYSTTSEQDYDSFISTTSQIEKHILQHGHNLRYVSHLLVKITQIHKGSVPCLGALEVMGRPAQNCGTFVHNYAAIINSRLRQENRVITLFHKTPAVNVTTVSSKDATKSEVTSAMPEEFIDPITLNIMTLPILLPSGMTIDQTTLDRHIHCEKTWGRGPSDPFTGVSLGTKVVPNVALKCRIDRFLLSSNFNVSNLGRTIGRTEQTHTTKLKLNSVKETAIKTQQKTVNRLTDNDQGPLLKKQKTASSQPSHVVDSLDLALEQALSVRKKPECKKTTISCLVATSHSTAHEPEAINREASDPSSNRIISSCPHCQHCSTVFQLPCQHIVCRNCLTTAVEKNQCPCCKLRGFDKREVVRVHAR